MCTTIGQEAKRGDQERRASNRIDATLFRCGQSLGFEAGDVNLYRYVMNNPTGLTDPSGLEVGGNAHLYPLSLGGSYDQPVFELTEAEHTAAHDVLRRHGVSRVPGTTWDAARANWAAMTAEQQRAIIIESMRAAGIPQSMIDARVGDVMSGCSPGTNRSPGRPSGYRAGQIVSSSEIQQARAPRLGGAGAPAPTGVGPIRTTTVRAMAAGNVYLTMRDALAAIGHNGLDMQQIDADYYFSSGDGSVFILQYYSWPRSMFSDPRRVYVAGPRAGQTEAITGDQFNSYVQEAERVWGRYIPGGLFSQPRFEPGTRRTSIPLTNWLGQPIGYIDRDGPHYYNAPLLPPMV